MNNWNFTGNLGKDAEQRFMPNGDSIVSFSVAVKSGYGDKAATTWPRCAMYGKRGESVLPFLKKGQLVGVSGEATLKEYTNKEGAKQVSLEVRVNDLTLLGKSESKSESSATTSRPQQSAKPAGRPDDSFSDFESDVPF